MLPPCSYSPVQPVPLGPNPYYVLVCDSADTNSHSCFLHQLQVRLHPEVMRLKERSAQPLQNLKWLPCEKWQVDLKIRMET